MTPREPRSEKALPWLVFAVFVTLTLLVTSYVWRTSRAADRARFDNAVQTTRDAIAARIETYVNVLTATRGLAVSDPAIPRDELRAYIRSLNVQRRYPGIQAIGLSLRVPLEEIDRLEQELRREGNRGFRVWPSGTRLEYHPTVLLEPLDRGNVRAMGYDMLTDSERRAAMERARDTGRPAATGVVPLIVDPQRGPGFLIYTPVYSTGTTPATLTERQTTLIGFIYAPLLPQDFFDGIFPSQERPEIGFEIRDDNELLYRTIRLPADPRFVAEDRMAFAGRTWSVRWISQRSGGGGVALITAATLLGGVAISALLFLLIATQLAAREQAEQTAARLRESEAALQRANQAKDEFLATLSHELRTPMTSIMGWSQMMSDDLDRESARQAIDAVRKSAKVQAQLIDDLLDVSRITAGKMRIETKPVELRPVVAAAIDTVRATAVAKQIELAHDLQPNVCVTGDAQRLQQVVWNLLSNAVKFTSAGGKVFVSVRDEGNDAVIEVRDTGQGIDPAFMPHLFERFRQADSSTTRAHMGLGLGLAIVHHLVELHGGTVAAESKGVGHGATFRIRMPLLRREGAAAAPERYEPDEAALRGVRVLVVDDDEEVRGYVAAVFRGSGAEVLVASSARQALDLLGEWAADVVLTDLAMPVADGFDLLHWIRSSPLNRVRTVPVVALTAFAMPEDRQRVLDGGFQGFVAKPVEPSHLRAAVAESLGVRR